MAQTSPHNARHPLDRSFGGTSPAPPPSADAPLRAQPPAAAGLADVDGLLRPSARRARVCVLCGRPLRAGQRMLRVHGTTVHARCTNTG